MHSVESVEYLKSQILQCISNGNMFVGRRGLIVVEPPSDPNENDRVAYDAALKLHEKILKDQ